VHVHFNFNGVMQMQLVRSKVGQSQACAPHKSQSDFCRVFNFIQGGPIFSAHFDRE
jgi:hypothetical protein